jgi:FtsZ-interacting cell division protein ZipA
MAAWVWVGIAIAVVAVLGVAAWQGLARRRSGRLQQRFGPEYNRLVNSAESKRDAESELEAREERRRRLDIEPLSEAARARYLQNWQAVQAQFVDDPRAAVATADSLIQSVMAERGYPVEDFEQRANDISVDHPRVVENYREGHKLAQASADENESTEDLRQAMRHYRALFDELLEADTDEPMARDRDGNERVTDRGRNKTTGRTVG